MCWNWIGEYYLFYWLVLLIVLFGRNQFIYLYKYIVCSVSYLLECILLKIIFNFIHYIYLILFFCSCKMFQFYGPYEQKYFEKLVAFQCSLYFLFLGGWGEDGQKKGVLHYCVVFVFKQQQHVQIGNGTVCCFVCYCGRLIICVGM